MLNVNFNSRRNKSAEREKFESRKGEEERYVKRISTLSTSTDVLKAVILVRCVDIVLLTRHNVKDYFAFFS